MTEKSNFYFFSKSYQPFEANFSLNTAIQNANTHNDAKSG